MCFKYENVKITSEVTFLLGKNEGTTKPRQYVDECNMTQNDNNTVVTSCCVQWWENLVWLDTPHNNVKI